MLKLSGIQWVLLVKATILLVLIKAGLQFLSFNQFRKTYARMIHVSKSCPYPEPYIIKAAWAVRTAAYRLPFALTCLPQALTLKYLLRYDPDMPLSIGVQTTAPQGFQAHAWVEKDGRIVIGDWPEETSYQPIWVWK